MTKTPLIDIDALLERAQRGACQYFIDLSNGPHGLVPDTTRAGSPSSIAAVGFGLTVLPIAVTRNYMPREVAVHRTLRLLRFFAASKQSEAADATGFKGFYYHFLDLETGLRTWQCELSVIDTALLMAGVLFAGAFYDESSAEEREIRDLSAWLYARVDWQWAHNGFASLSHGWTPESGFIHYGWDGYSEASMLYIMALGAPQYPLDPAAYKAWAATYQWENIYGTDVLYAGPLFVHQFSQAWLDYRGVQDKYMNDIGLDYFENSRRATIIQQAYAMRNPKEFVGYGKHAWGLTACEGPGFQHRTRGGVDQEFFGYVARAVPYGPDDGTISPTAVVASLPFAPEIVAPTISELTSRYPDIWATYGLKGSLNPSFSSAAGTAWVAEPYYGLDTGLTAMMIENYRSGLPWKITRRIAPLVRGFRKAGFDGGWLKEPQQ